MRIGAAWLDDTEIACCAEPCTDDVSSLQGLAPAMSTQPRVQSRYRLQDHFMPLCVLSTTTAAPSSGVVPRTVAGADVAFSALVLPIGGFTLLRWTRPNVDHIHHKRTIDPWSSASFSGVYCRLCRAHHHHNPALWGEPHAHQFKVFLADRRCLFDAHQLLVRPCPLRNDVACGVERRIICKSSQSANGWLTTAYVVCSRLECR